MTLDEAIKHCEEKAEEKRKDYERACAYNIPSEGCLECAKEHEQLAEWLKELKAYKERPQGEIVKCQDCKYRVKEWREDKRMKEKGYWVYGCKHFGALMGYWGFGGSDNEFCSDALRTDMRGEEE